MIFVDFFPPPFSYFFAGVGVLFGTYTSYLLKKVLDGKSAMCAEGAKAKSTAEAIQKSFVQALKEDKEKNTFGYKVLKYGGPFVYIMVWYIAIFVLWPILILYILVSFMKLIFEN